MANKSAHAFVGAIAGLGIYALIKAIKKEKWTFEGAIASTAGGAILACLPDIIEPALHPNHRGFFHSQAVLLGIGYANYKVLKSPHVASDLKMRCIALSAPYISHLLLDMRTPKGLPLLGLKS